MRIALARLLLSQVGHSGLSLMLLDEPTNHLDTRAKVCFPCWKLAEGGRLRKFYVARIRSLFGM